MELITGITLQCPDPPGCHCCQHIEHCPDGSEDPVGVCEVGVIVASVAGMFSKVGCAALGIAGRLALGLGGAFIGGMVVRVAEINYDWGTVTMGYEELLFSLLGAIAIVAVSRGIQYQMKKKKSK